MNFKIIHDLKSQKRKNGVYWNYKLKSYLTGIRIAFIVSLLTLILFLQNILFFKEEFQKSSQFDQNTAYPFIAISTLLLIFCFFSYLKYKKQKSEFYKKLSLLHKTEVNITNENIKFKSELNQTTISWDLIRNFLIVDNCLFLTQFDDKKNFEYLIDLNSLTLQEKNELIEFILNK